MARGKPSSGFKLGEWGDAAPETNLERPVGREGPNAEEQRQPCRAPCQGDLSSSIRLRGREGIAAKKTYLNRLGWGKGKRKNN